MPLPLKQLAVELWVSGELLRISGSAPGVYAEAIRQDLDRYEWGPTLPYADLFYILAFWTKDLNTFEAENFVEYCRKGQWSKGLEWLQRKLGGMSAPLAWWVAVTIEVLDTRITKPTPRILVEPSVN